MLYTKVINSFKSKYGLHTQGSPNGLPTVTSNCSWNQMKLYIRPVQTSV